MEGTMASLTTDDLAVPRPRDTRGGIGTPQELTNGASCLGVALGLADVAWASISAAALLLV
jgi:hypothetical protein